MTPEDFDQQESYRKLNELSELYQKLPPESKKAREVVQENIEKISDHLRDEQRVSLEKVNIDVTPEMRHTPARGGSAPYLIAGLIVGGGLITESYLLVLMGLAVVVIVQVGRESRS